MKSFLAVFALVAVFASTVLAVDPKDVPSHLQKNCVTVRSNDSSGSGAIVVRTVDGKKIAFVWTAYHVIDGLREVKTILQGGIEKKVVTYRDAQIVQEQIYDGSMVGDMKLHCKVLATSQQTDVALLQVRLPDFYKGGVEFVLDGSVTPVGTKLYHCGSPSGQELGHNSITPGIIAANGRMFDGLPYDQTTCSALPGSSGGLVAREDNGLYVGMLTLGIRGSDTFNYIVPVRRIIEWVVKNNLQWAIDAKAKVPSADELLKIKVEDTMNSSLGETARPAPAGMYYLIGTIRTAPTPATEPLGIGKGILSILNDQE